MQRPWFWLTALLCALSAVAWAQDGRHFDKRFRAFAKQHYEDPVIEEDKSAPAGLQRLLAFYSACERKYLNEDPLIPHRWVVSAKSVRREGELDKVLAEISWAPANEEEAVFVARRLLRSNTGRGNIVDTKVARRKDGAYEVTFHTEPEVAFHHTFEAGDATHVVTVGRGVYQVAQR